MKTHVMITLHTHIRERLEKLRKEGKIINLSSICETALTDHLIKLENIPQNDDEVTKLEEEKYRNIKAINDAAEYLLVNRSSNRVDFRKNVDFAVQLAMAQMVFNPNYQPDKSLIENKIIGEYMKLKDVGGDKSE